VSHAYHALRRGAALVDRSARGRIAVAGEDRRSWLQGLLTNDVAALGPGSGCYAAWLTPQGRLIADAAVLELGDRILLVVHDDLRGALAPKLEALIFSEDARVEDVSDSLDQIGVHGPRAPDAIAAALASAPREQEEPPAPGRLRAFALFQNGRWGFQGAAVVVARTDELGVRGYDLFVERAQAGALRAALAAAGAVPVDRETAEIVRVESGVPAFHADMDEETIPLEAGIEDRAISFTKGCYVGQEIIIRVLHRGHGRVARKLVGVKLDVPPGQALPPPGSTINAGGRDAGRLTSVLLSPVVGAIALGYVARDFVEPGTKLTVKTDGETLPAVVALLPFVNPTAERLEHAETD
jgi:folate-binding protein YgfZ